MDKDELIKKYGLMRSIIFDNTYWTDRTINKKNMLKDFGLDKEYVVANHSDSILNDVNSIFVYINKIIKIELDEINGGIIFYDEYGCVTRRNKDGLFVRPNNYDNILFIYYPIYFDVFIMNNTKEVNLIDYLKLLITI